MLYVHLSLVNTVNASCLKEVQAMMITAQPQATCDINAELDESVLNLDQLEH